MRISLMLSIPMLALSMAACSGGSGDGPPKGEPIAKVAAPAGKQWTDTVVKTEEGYKIGNPQAKLQLVEYGAITCPGCAAFSVQSHTELMDVVNTGVVAFEFRPLLVHGIQDVPGFLLAQCNGPDAYFGLTERLFADQQNWLGKMSTLTPEEQQSVPKMKPEEAVTFLANKMGLVEYVKQFGISEDAAKKCLTDKAAFDTLAKNTEKTMADGKVTGTPSFFLNDARLDAGNWTQVKSKLQEAGAR